MMDRHERRSHFADIDSTLTERFGSLCSPYQALHMPVSWELNSPFFFFSLYSLYIIFFSFSKTVNDVTIPQQLRSVVDLDTP